ncbi:hypothetical protein N9K75_02390 [bacterium]|nr:hypothetical protein [bacterium]|tara:strand:+ start:5322 stop:6152 length:831 start_codon:yes stop_codon:yes gene_type:complete
MKNLALSNVENYKNELDSNEHILFLKYVGLIHELFQGCTENIYIQKEDYLKYIMIKGIKNTFYIYNFLLLYTKNVELAIYHTQKSIIYYIEFISQICEDTNNLLQLNSKDATLFIFKKTIFEVNEDTRKNYKENKVTKDKLEMLQLYIDFYNNLLTQVISEYDFKTNNTVSLQKIIFTKLYNIVDTMVQIPIIYKHNYIRIEEKLQSLHYLLNTLNNYYHYSFINKNYLYLIEYCIKKLHKVDIDCIKVNNKLNKVDIEEKLQDYSVCKIFNYLVS